MSTKNKLIKIHSVWNTEITTHFSSKLVKDILKNVFLSCIFFLKLLKLISNPQIVFTTEYHMKREAMGKSKYKRNLIKMLL